MDKGSGNILFNFKYGFHLIFNTVAALGSIYAASMALDFTQPSVMFSITNRVIALKWEIKRS
jgi:hypothetical protein